MNPNLLEALVCAVHVPMFCKCVCVFQCCLQVDSLSSAYVIKKTTTISNHTDEYCCFLSIYSNGMHVPPFTVRLDYARAFPLEIIYTNIAEQINWNVVDVSIRARWNVLPFFCLQFLELQSSITVSGNVFNLPIKNARILLSREKCNSVFPHITFFYNIICKQ